MTEQTKVVAKKQKLTLNRETLRCLANNELQVLDGVVGGTNIPYTRVCEPSIDADACNPTWNC